MRGELGKRHEKVFKLCGRRIASSLTLEVRKDRVMRPNGGRRTEERRSCVALIALSIPPISHVQAYARAGAAGAHRSFRGSNCPVLSIASRRPPLSIDATAAEADHEVGSRGGTGGRSDGG